MMRKYAETGQAGSVTPRRPTKPGADSRTFTPPSSGAASPCVTSHLPSSPREQPEHQYHWQTLFSYNSAAAVAALADKIATELLAAATKSLPLQLQDHPPLAAPSCPPHSSAPKPNPKSVTPALPPNSRHPTPIRHMCQLWPSYDHSNKFYTSQLQIAFFQLRECRIPLSACRHQPAQHPLPQPRRNPPTHSHPPKMPHATHVSATAQLRPRY